MNLREKEEIRKEVIDEMKKEEFQKNLKENENVRKSIQWPKTDEILGEGGFGKVFKANYLGTPVAVKRPIGDSWGKMMASEVNIREEILRMSVLRHPNIVSMIASSGTMIVMEVFNGSIKKIHDYREMALVTRDCMRAVAYLQSHGSCMFHGDVKPDNIMVNLDQNGRITRAALGDFGVSKECSSTGDFSGTPGYMPESQGRNINSLADVFAVAVSVMDAYFKTSVHAKYKAALTDNTMDHANKLPEDIKKVISQMLVAHENALFYESKGPRDFYIKSVVDEWDILLEVYSGKLGTTTGIFRRIRIRDNFHTPFDSEKLSNRGN